MQTLGHLLQAVKPSPTLAITKQAAELQRQGVDVIGCRRASLTSRHLIM